MTDANRVRLLAATLLCELGRIDDPRLPLQDTTVREVMSRPPSEFDAPRRPLTLAEAKKILAEYFAGSPDRGWE